MDTQTTFPFEIGTFWKTAARMQLETLGLIVRRTQAYIDLPAQLSRCKTPDDLLAEQARFWEAAQREYLGRFESALSMLPLPPVFDDGQAKAVNRPRDYLTVSAPEPVPAPALSAPEAPRPAVPGKAAALPLRRSA